MTSSGIWTFGLTVAAPSICYIILSGMVIPSRRLAVKGYYFRFREDLYTWWIHCRIPESIWLSDFHHWFFKMFIKPLISTMCLLLVEFVGWKGSRDGLLTEIAGLVRSGWRWCAWYFWRWWGCHRGEKRPADWQWNSHFSSYAQHTSTTEPNSETSKATCVCWVYPRVSLSHYCYW